MVLHSGDMTCPAQLRSQQHCLNAGDPCLLKHLSIRGEVAPVDVKDGAETSLVEALQNSYMVSVCDPRLRAVQEGGQYHSSVDADLGVFLQVFVIPDTVVESAESTVCLCQSVVYIFINLCIRGDCASQVGKLLD